MSDDVDAFLRANRRSRTIKIGLVFLVVSSPLIYLVYKNYATRARIEERQEAYEASIRLTDADKKELAAAIPAARKVIEDAASTFVNTVTPQALEALEDSGSACPYHVRAPSMGAGESYVKYGSIDGNYFGNADYTLFAPNAPVKPNVTYDLATLDEIAKKLSANKADKNDSSTVRRLSSGPDNYLFIVGDKTDPVVLADSYLPGQLTGFAYLYSYEAHKVVCFTALAVQSSPTIDIEYTHMAGNYADAELKKMETARGVLARDLEVQIRTAIGARLHATL